MSDEAKKRKREMGVAYREALYRLGFRNAAVRGLLREASDGRRGARKDAEEALGKIAGKGGKEAIWPLMDAMWNKDEKVRISAAIALGEMGEKAEGAVHALMRVAKEDENEDVRCAAAWALGKVGKGAENASPLLKELVINGSRHFRYTVAFALPRIDNSAVEVLPILRQALREKGKYSAALRENASESLIIFAEKAEPAIPELIAALKDENEAVRTNASLVLEWIGGPAVPAIVGSIRPPERMRGYVPAGPEISAEEAAGLITRIGEKAVPALMDVANGGIKNAHNAIWLLGTLRGKAAPATGMLVGMLDREDAGLYAVSALKNISQESDRAIPGLVVAMKGWNGGIRQTAHAALLENADRAIPQLLTLLRESKEGYGRLPTVRESAAELLGDMGEKARAAGAVPALVGALKDRERDVRIEAAFALAKIEAAAKHEPKEPAAIPALVEALKDAQPHRRLLASAALREFGEAAADAAPALAEALGDSDAVISEQAGDALARIGERAIPAIEGVAIKDKKRAVRERGLEILGKIAERSDAVVPKVISAVESIALSDTEWEVREKGVAVLGGFAEKSDAAVPKVIPALSAALDDKKPEVRLKAIAILEKLADRTDAVVPGLTKAVKDVNAQVRYTAIASLGKLGEKAAPAVPVLIEVLGWSDLSIRGEASKTLAKIGEPAVPALVEALKDRDNGTRLFAAIDTIQLMGKKALPAVPVLDEILNQNIEKDNCLKAAAALCAIEGDAVLPRLHKAAKDRPDLRDGLVKMIKGVSRSTNRQSGVREISVRPPDSELERMQLFMGRALDDGQAKRNVVRS